MDHPEKGIGLLIGKLLDHNLFGRRVCGHKYNKSGSAKNTTGKSLLYNKLQDY